MISLTGMILLALALGVTAFAVFAFILSLVKEQKRWLLTGKWALWIGVGFILSALIVLVVAFLTDQFQLKYVAQNASSALPFYLKLSAIWAGQEGSLLLWAMLQSLFAAWVSLNKESEHEPLMTWTVIILSALSVFFIAMTLLFSNPFVPIRPVPSDGWGMNPLLRHAGMIFHPPILYIGYVGLAVPFAYGLAGLIVGKVDAWVRSARRWLSMSWLTLGVGLLLGARWAYDVLGWGGYWGWDPVENAGLMPWLIATALLHGMILQIRGKGFRLWNISLAVLAYALVIFGTFTTRSGFIQSVHAFSQSQIGWYFLGLLAVILVAGLAVLLFKRKNLGQLTYPDKFFSREGAFFFTLLLFLLITFSMLIGTLLPTLTQGRFVAPPAWFNQIIGPQLGALVFLIGVCPLVGKIRRTINNAWQRLIGPIAGLLFGMAFALVGGFDRWTAVVGLAAAGMAAGTIVQSLGRVLISRIKRSGEIARPGSSIYLLFQRTGGDLVHLGVILMAVGVIGTQQFSTARNVTLMPGESVAFDAYEVTYENREQEQQPDHLESWANLSIYRSGTFRGALSPQMTHYPNRQQTLAEPAIRTGLSEDLYVVLFQWLPDGAVSLNITINPLSNFLWVGGLILLLGGWFAWGFPSHDKVSANDGRQRIKSALRLIFGLSIIVLYVFVTWGGTHDRGTQRSRPRIGVVAPDFQSISTVAEVFSLKDHLGEVVVLNFWGSWCAPCEEELPALQRVWEHYADQEVQLVGIAMDDTIESVLTMAKSNAVTYPLIVERDGEISSAYGIRAVPETVIVDQEGKVNQIVIGGVTETQLRRLIDQMLQD